MEGCSFLEAHLSLIGMMEEVQNGAISVGDIKEVILNHDLEALLVECMDHTSTLLASRIARKTCWLKIWDLSLDLGKQGTVAMQSLFGEMTRPVFGPTPCTYCSESTITTSYFEHFIQHHHSGHEKSPDDFVHALSVENPDLSLFMRHFPPVRTPPFSQQT